MKSNLLSLARIVCAILPLFIAQFLHAQNSVGIGVKDPNPNAVLDLVSPDRNQGLLVPRVTTTQRTATSFVGKLSNGDKGLFVFDTDINSLFFWTGGAWARVDAPEVLQDLELTGTSLTITNNPNATAISLAPFLGSNTDEQTLAFVGNSLSILNGNSVDLSSLQDGFEANTDNQTLNFSGSSLSISGGNAVNLSVLDTDNQTLNLSGSNLSIAGGNSLDISSIDTNTQLTETEVDAFVSNNGFITAEVDGSTTNEIQNISTTGSAGNISISSGATLNLNVNDGDANPTNEIQDLNLAGNILTITNNGSATPIDLSPFSGTNTDNQTISLSGSNLAITGGNTIDISSIDTDTDTDDQTLNFAGTTLSIADGNSVNLSSLNTDNQTLGLSGSTLSISGGNNVNLSTIDTDDQTLSLSGTNLSIAGGNTIDISSINTDTQLDEAAVDAFIANNGYLTTEVDGSTTNEIQNISTNGTAGNITISSGATLSLNVNDADASLTNEIQDLSFAGQIIALSNDPGNTTIDLSGYDSDVSDDFNGDFTTLTNVPAGLADGDDVGLTSVASNATLTGNGNAVPLGVNVGTAANQIVQLNATGRLPAVDGSLLTNLPGITSVNSNATLVGDGNGTPLGVNVGTAANQIVQLNASGQLPAVSGALLTGLPTSPWTGSPNISYSGGNVGVGTSNPFNTMAVSGTFNTVSTNQGVFLDVQNISGTIGALTGIRFKKNGVTANQRYNSGIFYNGDNLIFATKTNATSTNIATTDAAMTLTSQGRVGIGTIAPSAQLSVSKNESSSSATSLNILEASGTSDASILFETQGGNAYSMGIDASDAHKFKITDNSTLGSNDRIAITSTGVIGIGTSSPVTTFQAEVETTFAGALYLDNNASSGTNYGLFTTMNTSASGTTYGVYSTGEDRDYFSGDVGIGTAAPSAKLDVNGDTELNGETRLNGNLVSAITADHISGTNETLATPTRRVLRVTSNVNNRGIEYIGAGQDGQELIIIHSGNGGSGFSTNIIFYRSGTGGAGIPVTANSLYMSGGSTYSLNVGSSIHFIYDGVLQGWVEISRSTNIIAIN